MRLPEEPDGAHEERTVAGVVQTHGVDLQLERTIEVVALPGLHLVGDTLCVALGPSLGVVPGAPSRRAGAGPCPCTPVRPAAPGMFPSPPGAIPSIRPRCDRCLTSFTPFKRAVKWRSRPTQMRHGYITRVTWCVHSGAHCRSGWRFGHGAFIARPGSSLSALVSSTGSPRRDGQRRLHQGG